MAVADTIDCVDCGGPCHLTPTEPPEDGWQPGDVVRYRCRDCGDIWYVEVAEEDLDDGEAGSRDGRPGPEKGRSSG